MAADPVQLLRSLSGVSPARPSPDQPTSRSDAASIQFADLLNKAQSGSISSDRPVTIDPTSELELTDEQELVLSAAADRLEAAGVRSALVVIDGKKLILDVHQRQVTPAKDSPLIDGIDGVLDLSTSTPPTPVGLFGPLVGAQAGGPGASAPGKRGALPSLNSSTAALENPAIGRLLAERARH